MVTYCANGSPHDRHYFENSRSMVAGIVTPPRIDLANRELLSTHLHAMYLTEVGLSDLDDSVSQVIDLKQPSTLPLTAEVTEALMLTPERKKRIHQRFENILMTLGGRPTGSWFTDAWIEQTIEDAPQAFDRAFDRWRVLYQSAMRQRDEAQRIIDDPGYKSSHEDVKAAKREEAQARRQLDLLRNENTKSRSQSEFYPYRYLDAEGFLPGYNFTRLPVRAFMPVGDDGEYISRPRHIALREFGPRNLIYHNGSKFEVHRQQMLDIESKLEKAKVSLKSGYFLRGSDYNLTNCPITGVSLSTDADRKLYLKLIELSEVQTYPRENITCEEEERSREGYDIRTYFAVDGPLEDVKVLDLKSGGERLLTLKFIPTARLYFVNDGWSYYRDKGFVIETKTGRWKKSPIIDLKPGEEIENPIERVQIFTHDVADALYIHPSSALGLSTGGVLTLQYALEKAIGNVFQVEMGEISSTLMGEGELPNVMIYEAAEGSLGVLSQIVENPDCFREVVQEAYRVCYFDLPEVVVFIDGSVHDDPDLRAQDREKRRKLRNSGFRVISHYYQDDLDTLIQQHPDIFSKTPPTPAGRPPAADDLPQAYPGRPVGLRVRAASLRCRTAGPPYRCGSLPVLWPPIRTASALPTGPSHHGAQAGSGAPAHCR